MAKTIHRIVFILIFVCLCIDSFSQNDVPSGNRFSVVRAYKSQIGVRERTGRNDGKEVEKYLATVGLGKGHPWCAAFVKWCLLQGNIIEARVINGMALSTEKRDAIVYRQGRYFGKVKSADVFTLFYRKLNRIGHTGFVHGWANKEAGSIFTVEGNTNSGGSRDGDGVYLRVRQIGGVHSISSWIKD